MINAYKYNMNLLKRTIEKTLYGFGFGVGMGFSFMVIPTNKQYLASRPSMWPDAAVATAVEQSYQLKKRKYPSALHVETLADLEGAEWGLEPDVYPKGK